MSPLLSRTSDSRFSASHTSVCRLTSPLLRVVMFAPQAAKAVIGVVDDRFKRILDVGAATHSRLPVLARGLLLNHLIEVVVELAHEAAFATRPALHDDDVGVLAHAAPDARGDSPREYGRRRCACTCSSPVPSTTTALLLAEDRKSKKRRRSDRIWAVHAVPWLFKMRFRTLIFSGKTADS